MHLRRPFVLAFLMVLFAGDVIRELLLRHFKDLDVDITAFQKVGEHSFNVHNVFTTPVPIVDIVFAVDHKLIALRILGDSDSINI